MKAKLSNTLIASLKPQDNMYEVLDNDLPDFSVRIQPSGTITYFVRYRLPNGRRGRVQIGSGAVFTPAQARAEARQKLADATRGIDPAQERRERSSLTLGEFVENEYGPTYLVKHKVGSATLARLKRCYAAFWNVPLGQLTAGAIEKWKAQRLADGKSAATVNRDLTALRGALSRAADWDFLKAHPMSKVKQEKEDRVAKVRYLTLEEEKKLMESLDIREERIRTERDTANKWRRERGHEELVDLRTRPFADYLKPMVIVSLNTGLRRGELFDLQWRDIDFRHNLLTVRGAGAKSGRTRHVPMNQFVCKIMEDWRTQCDGDGRVFESPKGGRFDNVNTSFEAVLEEAGIAEFTWHSMRHHFASWLVMKGVPLNTVRELLGHADIKTTLVYAHLAPDVKAEAVSRLLRHPTS